MQDQNSLRSTQFSFPLSKCAIASLCCAFSIEPLFAQTVNWASGGADVANSRYAAIDQITLTNVSQLKPAWSFTTPSGTEAVQPDATPLVVDGMMYISGTAGGVFALNATTGKQVWHYTVPNASGTNRGVAYGEGLIFYGHGANLVALNAKNGALTWTTQIDSTKGASISIAPQFILANNGTVPEVIVGPAGGDGGLLRGHLDAYNAATGKLLWRFYTQEPSSWAGDSYLTGGVATWQTPTFDPTLNMVLFGTGNAYPDFLGGGREGANLYGESIVALDATTGELQWFFQLVHHDLWDFDVAQPIILFSWNGIPVVEGSTKAGSMFILDRASGESLFPYQEVAVPPTPASAAFQHPWPTQPVSSIESLIERTVEPVSVPAGTVAVPEFTPPSTTTTAVYAPNAWSGYEWYPAAYSPRTSMIYTHARYAPLVMEVANDIDTANKCPGFTCGVVGGVFGPPGRGEPIPGVSHGVYGAINTLTGKIAWSIPILTSAPASGMTVAGDLVFFGDSDGIFYAASAATGEILWVFDALTVPGAAGAESTGAAVYESGGVEYVANEFAGTNFVTGNALIAFALPASVVAAEKSAAGKARVK